MEIFEELDKFAHSPPDTEEKEVVVKEKKTSLKITVESHSLYVTACRVSKSTVKLYFHNTLFESIRKKKKEKEAVPENISRTNMQRLNFTMS